MEKWELDEHVISLPSTLKNGDVVEPLSSLSWQPLSPLSLQILWCGHVSGGDECGIPHLT
eukprot:1160721-Pelagomonas_calceolata.AAC.8